MLAGPALCSALSMELHGSAPFLPGSILGYCISQGSLERMTECILRDSRHVDILAMPTRIGTEVYWQTGGPEAQTELLKVEILF